MSLNYSKNGDLVSVIIPIYNVIDYLEECLQSIINQTYENIEIILIDDGSTDGSEKLCDLYAKKDKRIKVIHQRNKGLPGARNSGLDVSNGKWILFVDADDWLVKNAIELVLDGIDESTDIVLFELKKTIKFEENVYEKVKIRRILSSEDIKFLLNDSFNPMYKKKKSVSRDKVSACSKIYNANFINKNKLFFYEDVKVHEDIPYAIKVYSKTQNVVYIDASIYRYRYNPMSITNSYRPNYPEELAQLLNRLECIAYELEEVNEGLLMLNNRKIASTIYLLFKCCCHKDNLKNYSSRKKEYENWCKKMYIQNILENIDISEYQCLKKILTVLLKINIFWVLDFTIKLYGVLKGNYEKIKNICCISSAIS